MAIELLGCPAGSVLCGAAVAYVIYYALSSLFFSKKSPSLLGLQFLREPAPLVTDRKTRKAVLKPVFRADEVAGQQYDVVVIGSGMGGLSAAVLLARAGRRVLVLEQHGRIGGCCHTFGSKGVDFDTGVHYVGEMQPTNLVRVLADQVTEGQVEWAPMDPVYDVAVFEENDRVRTYPMVKGRDELKTMFLKNFPDERKAIEGYFSYLKMARRTDAMPIMMKSLPLWLARLLISTGLIHLLSKFFRLAEQSVQQVLDSLTDNQQLKGAICYIFGDAGVPPAEFPFVMHAKLINHFTYGAFYPKGGPSEIPFQMVKIIQKYGGSVYGKARVTRILCDSKGRATGVRVKGKEGVEVEIPTKVVVSDAGLMNTLTSLLPPEVAQKTTAWPLLKSNTVKRSLSYLTMFVTLEGTAEELGLKASNFWVFTDSDLNKACHDYTKLTQDDLLDRDVPFLFISFPSCKDPAWQERCPGRSNCVVITLSKWEWFEEWQHQKTGKRDQRYKDFKTTIGRRMWGQVLKHFPQLDGKMLEMDFGTPVTNQHYMGQGQGEMYGLDHGISRFSPEVVATLRPNIGVPGLYLTGQDVLFCGFPAAMFAGMYTASAILNRYLISDLMNLQGTIKAINSNVH